MERRDVKAMNSHDYARFSVAHQTVYITATRMWQWDVMNGRDYTHLLHSSSDGVGGMSVGEQWWCRCMEMFDWQNWMVDLVVDDVMQGFGAQVLMMSTVS